jgi:hypothetical protein
VQPKGLFLAAMLSAVLAAAPLAAAGQANDQTESVGANQLETAKHEAVKNAVNNIRAAVQAMKEQEKILNELVADESSPRAAYTKFKAEGAPVRAKAETEETKEGGYEAAEMKEGGMNATIHKLPGRTKAVETTDPEGAASSQRAPASRAECSNNLKQLSLGIDRDADKLHRLSRQRKQKTFLMAVKQLQVENRRVRETLKELPAKPDEEADQAALAAISEAIERTEAAVDELGRIKVQF